MPLPLNQDVDKWEKSLGGSTKPTLPAAYPHTGRNATVSFRCEMITEQTQRIIVNKRRRKQYYAAECLCYVSIGFASPFSGALGCRCIVWATLKLWLYHLCMIHTYTFVHMYMCFQNFSYKLGENWNWESVKKCNQQNEVIAHRLCVFTQSLDLTQCQLHHYLSTRLVRTIARTYVYVICVSVGLCIQFLFIWHSVSCSIIYRSTNKSATCIYIVYIYMFGWVWLHKLCEF